MTNEVADEADKPQEYLYRYEGYASRRLPMYVNGVFCDPNARYKRRKNEPLDDGVFICKFPVTRRTAHGAWIYIGGGRTRFVLNDSHKRYAYDTLEGALNSFTIRKRKQQIFLRRMLEDTNRTLQSLKVRKKPYQEKVF
jgi:hypothetical protein